MIIFANAIIQKVIKPKLVDNYRVHVRKKDKMIKMQHIILCTLTNE